MAESPQQASWAVMDLLMPHSSLLVRAISFVCLALGTIFILPLFFMLGYDLFLWIWRHASSLFSTRGSDDVPASASVSNDPSSSSAATTSANAHGQETKQTRKR